LEIFFGLPCLFYDCLEFFVLLLKVTIFFGTPFQLLLQVFNLFGLLQ